MRSDGIAVPGTTSSNRRNHVDTMAATSTIHTTSAVSTSFGLANVPNTRGDPLRPTFRPNRFQDLLRAPLVAADRLVLASR